MNSTIPGLAVPFIPETEPVLVVIGLVYVVVGGAFGVVQRTKFVVERILL